MSANGIVKYITGKEEDRVPTTIDLDLLKDRCQRSIESYKPYGQVVDTKDGIYIYRNNGANILAVAHLDVVKHLSESKIFWQSGDKVHCPQLDDRLGVYLIMDVLPKFGLNYDVLLTEGEEVGRSTAAYFDLPEGKEYNWMFEIDRGGLDSVMYQFETPERRTLLESYGLKVGRGTFTDIRYLDFLKIWGVNFGCAYYSQHSSNCYVDLAELEDNLLPKIIQFIQDNKDTKMVYDPKETKVYTSYSYKSNTAYTYGEDYVPDYDNPSRDRISNKYHRKNTSTYKRYIHDPSTKQYVCSTCHRLFSLCPAKVCDYKPTTPCKICTSEKCVGYNRCTICKFYYHNNPYVKLFGICYPCLLEVASVRNSWLMAVLDHNEAVRDTATDKIFEFLIPWR